MFLVVAALDYVTLTVVGRNAQLKMFTQLVRLTTGVSLTEFLHKHYLYANVFSTYEPVSV